VARRGRRLGPATATRLRPVGIFASAGVARRAGPLRPSDLRCNGKGSSDRGRARPGRNGRAGVDLKETSSRTRPRLPSVRAKAAAVPAWPFSGFQADSGISIPGSETRLPLFLAKEELMHARQPVLERAFELASSGHKRPGFRPQSRPHRLQCLLGARAGESRSFENNSLGPN
jgi:hypothetical protein